MKPKRFPRTIRRFPRTIDTRPILIDANLPPEKSFSMIKVYETLYKIAKGKPVSTKEELVACRWYGINAEHMTKEAARYFAKGGSIRFPRSKHGKKS